MDVGMIMVVVGKVITTGILVWFLVGALLTIPLQCSAIMRARFIRFLRDAREKRIEQIAGEIGWSVSRFRNRVRSPRDDQLLDRGYILFIITGFLSFYLLWRLWRKESPSR